MLEILKKMNPLYIEGEQKSKKLFTPTSDKSVTIKAQEPKVRKSSPFRESITSQMNTFNASKKVRDSQSGTLRPKTGNSRNQGWTKSQSKSTTKFDSRRPSNSKPKSEATRYRSRSNTKT